MQNKSETKKKVEKFGKKTVMDPPEIVMMDVCNDLGIDKGKPILQTLPADFEFPKPRQPPKKRSKSEMEDEDFETASADTEGTINVEFTHVEFEDHPDPKLMTSLRFDQDMDALACMMFEDFAQNTPLDFRVLPYLKDMYKEYHALI